MSRSFLETGKPGAVRLFAGATLICAGLAGTPARADPDPFSNNFSDTLLNNHSYGFRLHGRSATYYTFPPVVQTPPYPSPHAIEDTRQFALIGRIDFGELVKDDGPTEGTEDDSWSGPATITFAYERANYRTAFQQWDSVECTYSIDTSDSYDSNTKFLGYYHLSCGTPTIGTRPTPDDEDWSNLLLPKTFLARSIGLDNYNAFFANALEFYDVQDTTENGGETADRVAGDAWILDSNSFTEAAFCGYYDAEVEIRADLADGAESVVVPGLFADCAPSIAPPFGVGVVSVFGGPFFYYTVNSDGLGDAWQPSGVTGQPYTPDYWYGRIVVGGSLTATPKKWVAFLDAGGGDGVNLDQINERTVQWASLYDACSSPVVTSLAPEE